MSTTEALLGDMQRRRAELYLKQVTAEEARWQLLQRVYDGEDENDLATLLPAKIQNAHAFTRNRQGKNPARRGVQKIIGSVQSGTLQWSGDEQWSDEQKLEVPKLARFHPLLAQRVALFGQAALLPWTPPESDPVVSPLTGFLWPVYSDWDATTVSRLLAFEATATSGGTLYTVYELEPGRVRVYAEVRAITDYQHGKLIADVTGNVPDRLPCAHAILTRDGNMHPEGLLEPALGAHWDYRRKALQRNIAYELTALPRKVVTGADEGADSFDPLEVEYLPEGATVTYPFPQHLAQLDKGLEIAEHDVLGMLHAPEVSSGAGESGEARMMSMEEQVHWAKAVADGVADCLAQASELMAEYGMLPGPLEFTLQPHFSAQLVAQRQQILANFEKGLLSRYGALLLLQGLGDDVPEVELEAAEEEFNTQKVPPEVAPGDLTSAMQAAMGGANANPTDQAA